MHEFFAHGIGRADVLDGMVRLELVTLSPGPDGVPIPEPSRILWLPLEGFLRSAAVIDGLRGELAKAGLVRTGPRAGVVPASPNFPVG
jgi:hypothetical protein